MTASQAPRPLAPLPIRVRPQRAETTESYARRLARANHLRPSYLRTFPCDPPRHTGAIRPWRLAAISGRSARALEHALADLTQGSPPGRQPRAPGSVRILISTWLLTEPELTPAQIWQRLLDEHDAGISCTTIGHYRRSIINSHYRLNAASRAGSDDSNQPQSPVTPAFIRTSDASPIASQTGPASTEPQSRADLSGTGQQTSASEHGDRHSPRLARVPDGAKQHAGLLKLDAQPSAARIRLSEGGAEGLCFGAASLHPGHLRGIGPRAGNREGP